MHIPVICGLIDRRILVNFQASPQALARILPFPFRPRLINGVGMAGVCLIRLSQIRPRFIPASFGISSENGAHRIAVEWEENGQCLEGVYIPRRDTSSRVNSLVGGWLFPGEHHHAHFRVQEKGDSYAVAFDSDDGATHLAFEGHLASSLPPSSAFPSLSSASEFFARGSLGYSAKSRPDQFDGLELRCLRWQVEPLTVDKIESSFFEDASRFASDELRFDCALLMRGVEHEWHSRETLCASRAG
jgi:hypothetical protein